MISRALTLLLMTSLIACAKKNSSKLDIQPGDAGTFVALGTETELSLTEPAKGNEHAFHFQIKTVPNKGISIGRAVGEGQADKNEGQYFIPASITKVITASLALKLLGDQFQFTTRIGWTPLDSGKIAHNLTIFADGDPLVGKDRMKSIAEELKKRGVERLTGHLNLISSDPRKDFSFPAYGMDREDYINCYGSRAQAFNLQRNCSPLQILGWNQARWQDSTVQVPVAFENTARDFKTLAIRPALSEPRGFLNSYTVNFTPKGKKFNLDLPIFNVKSWYGNSLLVELKRTGFDIRGLEVVSNRPVDAQTDLQMESFDLHSASLCDLVKKMNKTSDNFLAEALFKSTAGFDPDRNIQTAGMNMVKKGIAEWMSAAGTPGLAQELKLFDGAGLSRANQVTPRAFIALLKSFTKEPFFPKLWASLPIAGVDGTLRGRMGSSPALGTVRAKTGTLKGSYQLAGYIPHLNAKGEILEYIPFVILSATSPDQSQGARNFQDRVLSELSLQINKDQIPAKVEKEASVIATQHSKSSSKRRRRK